MYLARYALPEINKQSGGAVIRIGAVNHAYAGVNAYTAANLGAEGLAAAMFEDDPRNLAAPHEMGMRTVHVAPEPHEADHIHHHTDDLTEFLARLR